MKTIRVYFDETLIEAFMEYSKENIRTHKHRTELSRYMNEQDIKILAMYFANRSEKFSCNNKGETFEGSEKTGETPTQVWLPNGSVIKDKKKIIQMEQKAFADDYNAYIEFNLFHWIWCDIERILRVNYYDLKGNDDPQTLKRARRYAEKHIA